MKGRFFFNRYYKTNDGLASYGRIHLGERLLVVLSLGDLERLFSIYFICVSSGNVFVFYVNVVVLFK